MSLSFALRLLIEVACMIVFVSMAIAALPFLAIHEAVEWLFGN